MVSEVSRRADDYPGRVNAGHDLPPTSQAAGLALLPLRRDEMNRRERKIEDRTMAIQFSIKPRQDRRDHQAEGGYLTRQIRMIECRVCGASNHSSREGCFNCGTVLRVEGAGAGEFVRVVVFGDISASRWDELGKGDGSGVRSHAAGPTADSAVPTGALPGRCGRPRTARPA